MFVYPGLDLKRKMPKGGIKKLREKANE